MANELGKIRQSAVIMNYGPGAIIDFRIPKTGAAVSVVSAGLEQWAKQVAEAGVSMEDLKRLTEPRLAEKLGVKYFRLPPVSPDMEDKRSNAISLLGVRFPKWLQCPECNTIRPYSGWPQATPGDASRYCVGCSTHLTGKSKRYVVPVRFILACRRGHLSDFPWSIWVHQGKTDCRNNSIFKIRNEGAGLAKMFVFCPKCERSRSMGDVFKPGIHRSSRCEGERPWLVDGTERCDEVPITLQRGTSNLYFPQMESALLIPPWSDQVVLALGDHWRLIESVTTRENRHKHIEIHWDSFPPEIKNMGMEPFIRFVDQTLEDADSSRSGNLRWDEYQQFMVSRMNEHKVGGEFVVRPENLPDEEKHLSHLQRVVSLREIRALKGFTRIEPPPGKPPVFTQFLSKAKLNWLPAIEVRGEGIFLALDPSALASWENNEKVINQAKNIETYNESRVLNPEGLPLEVSTRLGARYLLIHSLSHILMKQLSLQCGYSTASLRERLYVGDGDTQMAGVMIYTATSDSDGTLGGLQRQGKIDLFQSMFVEAIRANEWCSSDPLCIKGLVSESDADLLAACHSCLLAPETSCEDYNRFLDRTTLVGTPEDRSLGFFSEILK